MSWPTWRTRKESSLQEELTVGTENKIKKSTFIPLSSRYKKMEAKQEQEGKLKSLKKKKVDEMEKEKNLEKVCLRFLKG